MTTIARMLRQQWAGFLALFLVLGGVAYGGVPEVLKLGARNSTDETTFLRNTGAGAALDLRVDDGPALAVSTSGLVERLNAQFLQGKEPGAFAPASGSANYLSPGEAYTKDQADDRFALSEGDPDYAPADSSYTKSEADRRYAPTEGSRVYAEKADIYSRKQADERFAPAEGSPSYLASEGPQVLASASAIVELKVGAVSAPVLSPTAVTAPSEGTIAVIVSGFCTKGRTTGDLALRAQVGKQDEFTTYEASGVCTAVAFKSVKRNETTTVAAFLTTKLAGEGSNAILTAQVLFQPFERVGDAAGRRPGHPAGPDASLPPHLPVRG